ncbi:MAG: hydroxymethylglutaryl-CoA lyase, partial [Actinobacteria bacterium]|nr:hydroxymethylglutaryl-CoA lyase [Actinomycetota bacterium]
PNLKGFERSIKTNLKQITVFLSASESHNRKNINCSTSDSLNMINDICRLAGEKNIKVKVIIATAFGCPFEGKVPVERILFISKELYKMGCHEIAYGDTIGIANPKQCFILFKTLKNELPGLECRAHFHDTSGMGLANVIAAMQAGVKIFDSSIGGLGGCPFAPGASGNISTENLVYMLSEMGINTGINIRELIKCIGLIEKVLNRKIVLIPELKKFG